MLVISDDTIINTDFCWKIESNGIYLGLPSIVFYVCHYKVNHKSSSPNVLGKWDIKTEKIHLQFQQNEFDEKVKSFKNALKNGDTTWVP
ncbi:MAG: hypothetical protein OXG97_02415 [Candidatus Poribacteria bacterium]|nr:hypothetical protein [Candidatus Poribacteria bacterium]